MDPLRTTKRSWKKKVKSYVLNKTKQDLLNMLKKYKKIDLESVANDPFENKEYFLKLDLESVRMRLRISSGMVNKIKGNYKDKYRRRNKSITCSSCAPLLRENKPDGEPDKPPEKPPDTQIHLLEECVAFEDVRESTDLKTDAGLVSFFNEVVKRRTEMEENL